MKKHENVLVFSGGATIHQSQSKRRMPYYPQGLAPNHRDRIVNFDQRRLSPEPPETAPSRILAHRAVSVIRNNQLVGSRTLSQFLITVDDALRALAEARSPEQLIGLANTAESLRRYAQRARLGMAAQNRCAELRLRAERKLGQYLAGTPRNSGGRPKPVPLRNGFPTLDDLGITRKLSHRAQRLAALPATDFDWYLGTAAEQKWEITTRLLLHYSKRRQATARNRHGIASGSA